MIASPYAVIVNAWTSAYMPPSCLSMHTLCQVVSSADSISSRLSQATAHKLSNANVRRDPEGGGRSRGEKSATHVPSYRELVACVILTKCSSGPKSNLGVSPEKT